MRNPEAPVNQIDIKSFSKSTIDSEENFIKALTIKYPAYPDFNELNLFLINLAPGSERVAFIARMVQDYRSDIKQVFKDLIVRGLKKESRDSFTNQQEYRNSVNILIEDFCDENSNFPMHEGSHESKNIFIAISARRINLVKAILERDPDSINAKNSNNKSPIHIAVYQKNKKLLEELLKHPSLDLYAKCNMANHDRSASSQLNVFEIARTETVNSDIISILENEHRKRLINRDQSAIIFENSRISEANQKKLMVWDDPFHSEDQPPRSLNSSQVSVSHPLDKDNDSTQGEDLTISSSSAISSGDGVSAFSRVGSKKRTIDRV